MPRPVALAPCKVSQACVDQLMHDRYGPQHLDWHCTVKSTTGLHRASNFPVCNCMHFASIACMLQALHAFSPFSLVPVQRLLLLGPCTCHDLLLWAAAFAAIPLTSSLHAGRLLSLRPWAVLPSSAALSLCCITCKLQSFFGTCAGGLVQVTRFAVLPSISPALSLILVLLAMLPCLAVLWRRPQPHLFLPAAAYASLCSFMFGYHVHEKAILTVTIPLALQAVQFRADARVFFVLSTAGHVALLPLLFTAAEYPIKVRLKLHEGLQTPPMLPKYGVFVACCKVQAFQIVCCMAF